MFAYVSAYGKLRRQEYPSNRLSPYCYAVSRNSPSYCSGVPLPANEPTGAAALGAANRPARSVA